MCLDGSGEFVPETKAMKKVSERTAEPIWVVVQVIRGIPVDVAAFHDWKSAKRRAQSWRRDMQPENDEIGFFEVQIGSESTEST